MKILVMLYCADTNQLIVSDILKSEFDKLGHICVVKDLASYKFENHGNKELAFAGGLYEDLRFGNYDAIVFLHSYAARIFSMIKSIKKINVKSFIIQIDYSLHFSYFDVFVDKYFVPNEILADEYISHGIPASRIIVSGILVPNLNFSDANLKHNEVFCFVLADGYDSSDVLAITQKAEDILDFDISFAVLSFDSLQYSIYSRFSSFDENFIVYSHDDTESFTYLPKPDVIISNSQNASIYSSMKCKVPIILFDTCSHKEADSFSYLSQLDCLYVCESFDDVFNALNGRFFERHLGKLLSQKCEMHSKYDAVQIISENIINYNNKFDN